MENYEIKNHGVKLYELIAPHINEEKKTISGYGYEVIHAYIKAIPVSEQMNALMDLAKILESKGVFNDQ